MPLKAIIPSTAMKPSGVRVTSMVKITPMSPKGAVSIAIIMRGIFLSWNMRTVMMTKIMAGNGTFRLSKAVTLSSAAPSIWMV